MLDQVDLNQRARTVVRGASLARQVDETLARLVQVDVRSINTRAELRLRDQLVETIGREQKRVSWVKTDQLVGIDHNFLAQS